MKQIILTGIIALTMSIANAQHSSPDGIQFFEGTWAEATKKATAEDKPIFLDGYTSWCGPCKMLAAQIFPQKVVGDFFNANFINVSMDMEKGEGPAIAGKFRVNAYPTLIVVNGEGTQIDRAMGFMPAEKLIEFGKQALQKVENIGDMAAKYQNGERSPEFLRKYAIALRRSGGSAVKIGNEYMATQTDFATPDNLKFIYETLERVDSKLFDLFIQHRPALNTLKGEAEVNKKIKAAANATVATAAEFKSIELLKEAKTKLKTHLPAEANDFNIASDMNFYLAVGDNSQYAKAAKVYAKKVAKQDISKLFQLAKTFDEKIQDPKLLKKSLKWAESAATGYPKYEHSLVFANLLYKTGDLKAAKVAATRAVELATNEKINASAAQLILDKIK